MRDTDGANAVLPTPDEELRLNVLALEVHRRDDEVAVISSLKHFTVEVALKNATTGEDDRAHDGRQIIATLVYEDGTPCDQHDQDGRAPLLMKGASDEDGVLKDGRARLRLHITVLSALCDQRRFRVSLCVGSAGGTSHPTLCCATEPVKTLTKLRRGTRNESLARRDAREARERAEAEAAGGGGHADSAQRAVEGAELTASHGSTATSRNVSPFEDCSTAGPLGWGGARQLVRTASKRALDIMCNENLEDTYPAPHRAKDGSERSAEDEEDMRANHELFPCATPTGALGAYLSPHTANGIEGGACNGAAEAGADSDYDSFRDSDYDSFRDNEDGTLIPLGATYSCSSLTSQSVQAAPSLDRLWAQVNQNSEMLRQLQRAQNVLCDEVRTLKEARAVQAAIAAD